LLTFALVFGLAMVLGASLVHLVGTGIGVWGNTQNVAWAWDITGFVFWIGIGHAGTLISAVLFLFRQKWRTSVSRAAEAITLFAVLTAAVYPLFHMGRVWLAYWLFPIPTQMGVWPNFKSPLVWDVFAVTSYFIVSVLFWYMGMVPDLATLRDRAAEGMRKRCLNWLSLGWIGSQRHYVHYETAYLLLAGLATPLVISVHTVVSFDFAVSITPGWHSTLFPPYFVAGAVFSGSAMVVALMILVRRALGLEKYITLRHLDAMNKIVLVTGCMLAYSYAVEFFLAAQGSDVYEQTTILGRFLGPYSGLCWVMLGCNALLPQLYWSKRIRTSIPAMLAISLLINVGMWLERFVIIVTSQHRSFLPATWSDFHPTLIDGSTFLGTIGLFLSLFVLFVRFAPSISMSEVKALVAEDGEVAEQDSDASEVGQQGRSLTSVLRFKGKPGLVADEDKTSTSNDWIALMGEYSDSVTLVAACRRVSKFEHAVVDARAPYPIRAARRALGIGRSPLPYFALVSGALGGSLAFAFQFWAESINYPNVMGGKPPGAWQAYVPITFEVTVLSAALGCFIGLWYLCGLPAARNTARQSSLLRSATNTGFCLVVETQRPQKQGVVNLLHTTGAVHVTEIVS
jgi:molybdopterin-containing oxidoreductase family membrane subunit